MCLCRCKVHLCGYGQVEAREDSLGCWSTSPLPSLRQNLLAVYHCIYKARWPGRFWGLSCLHLSSLLWSYDNRYVYHAQLLFRSWGFNFRLLYLHIKDFSHLTIFPLPSHEHYIYLFWRCVYFYPTCMAVLPACTLSIHSLCAVSMQAVIGTEFPETEITEWSELPCG